MIQLIVLVVITFMLLYLQSYFRTMKTTQIIQTSLINFHPNILLEKEPIYIEDNIYNPADIISSVFKYQYIYKVLSLSNKLYWKKNLSSFVIIYNDQDYDVNINIINPNYCKDTEYFKGLFVNKFYKVSKTTLIHKQVVQVILKPYNMLVLPLNWIYNTDVDNVLEIHLFDCISRIYSFIA